MSSGTSGVGWGTGRSKQRPYANTPYSSVHPATPTAAAAATAPTGAVGALLAAPLSRASRNEAMP